MGTLGALRLIGRTHGLGHLWIAHAVHHGDAWALTPGSTEAVDRALHHGAAQLDGCGFGDHGSVSAAEHGHTLVRLSGFHRLEEVVESCADDGHLPSLGIRVAALQPQAHSGLGLPHFFVHHVGQIVVAGVLILQFGNQVAFKRTGTQFRISAPILFGTSLIQHCRTGAQAGVVDGLDHFGKRLNHLGAHIGIRCQGFGRASGQHAHVAGIGQHANGIATHTAKVVIHRVPPLVAQAPGPTLFGKVDHHFVTLIVRGCWILAARATGAKGQAQLAIERDSLGGEPQNCSHIHERVERIVEVLLAAPLLHPVTELHATKAKRLAELLGRHIQALAHVLADAGAVGVGTLQRNFFVLLQLGGQLLQVLVAVLTSFSHGLERACQLDVVAADLLAHMNLARAACRPNIKAGHIGLGFLLGLVGMQLLERLQGLLLGVTGSQLTGPVAKAAALGRLLHSP